MKRKAISCLLVLASILTMTPSIPTMAAENQADKTVVNETLANENHADKTLTDETQSDGTSADGLQETNASGSKAAVVKYDQASSFTVTIPKSIVLDSNKTATYNVKVKGDILGNEIITVVPDATVTLNDANGKDPVTGNIAQEKTEFSSTEVNTNSGNTTGSVLANDLTSGDWSGNFKFVIGTNQIGNGIVITSENLATYGIKTTGDVVIPEYVTDNDNTRHAVTSISDYAFRDCNEMTSVAIADSVTEIGTGAFVNCSKLSKAAVPNSVRSIGNSVFDGCTSLSSISYNGNEYDLSNIVPAFVENGVSVGSNVFDHTYSEPVYVWSENGQTCTAKRTCVNHPSAVETEEATISSTIKEAATCTTKGTTTYTATFKDTTFVTQTKDIQDIAALGHTPVNGYCTRCNEKVAGLYDANGAMLCSWEDSGIDITTDRYGGGAYLRDDKTCYNVINNKYKTTTRIVLPDTITRISAGAFDTCTMLTQIDLPNNLVSIGNSAFNGKGLKSVNMPNSVTQIGAYAFRDCINLAYVVLSNKLSSVQIGTFYNCSGLTNIGIPDSVTSIDKDAFYKCTSLINVSIPNSVTSIGNTAFAYCSQLPEVNIPGNVTTFGSYVFRNCTDLTKVIMNNGITTIGNCMFYGCSYLSQITLPETITSIGSEAFRGCNRLKTITSENSGYIIRKQTNEVIKQIFLVIVSRVLKTEL